MNTKNSNSLQPAQELAVQWNDGPLMVLAGPGTGKTMVITSRIARLLSESEDESFRVLALTFTNKAADEMQSRAQAICEAVEERASIGTFHSFCMQILQQHGSHIGIQPGFTVYSQDDDRREVLKDAMRRHSFDGVEDADRYLKLIDKLKGMLVAADACEVKFKDKDVGAQVARIYEAYDQELALTNALDFNSLIMRAYQLVSSFDGIAQRYRRTYRYWMLDEFQDTNRAQYRLLKALAGDKFRNIFVVADDDQIIYQWNGASFAQLQKFRADFNPQLVQLPTNFRCPAPIVNAANNLVRHNSSRTAEKLPLEAGKTETQVPTTHSILLGAYATESDEASAVANMIKVKGRAAWSQTVVLARSRGSLETIKSALLKSGVSATLSQRKDDFSSPQYRWLHALLRQLIRSQDVRNFTTLVNSFNRWKGIDISSELICAQAAASGRSYLSEWITSLQPPADQAPLVGLISSVAANPLEYKIFISSIQHLLSSEASQTDVDLDEDSRAWNSLERAIAQQYGRKLPLEEFLQHMALQSKEPPPPQDTVTLMTIHAAKGKEFAFVFLVSACEGMLPSFQSLKSGDDSPEIEEERRNCFVAITRTQEQLVITWPHSYKGWKKLPSRFLTEMGFNPERV